MRGAALKNVMESALSARQMSVSGLARVASVQRGDIYRWWRGESRPTRNSLARIATALELDPALLRQALGDAPTATESGDDLVAMVRDQTALIEALRAEMRQAHEEQAAALRGVRRALTAAAKARTPAT